MTDISEWRFGRYLVCETLTGEVVSVLVERRPDRDSAASLPSFSAFDVLIEQALRPLYFVCCTLKPSPAARA